MTDKPDNPKPSDAFISGIIRIATEEAVRHFQLENDLLRQAVLLNSAKKQERLPN